MVGESQGLSSMAPAMLPSRGPGVGEVTAPMYGPNSTPPGGEPIGEEVFKDDVELDAVKRLIGQFKNELDLSDFARLTKERAWIKVEKYLQGKDVNPPPPGYTESTFFYRRLPRITQIGKAKLYKHVCPLQGRPWEIKPSPRHKQGEISAQEDERITNLREEIEDIQEAHEGENKLDDMCEFMSNLGTCVAVGPIQISQPRLRWQDGAEGLEGEDALKPMWELYDPKEVYPDPNTKKAQSLEYVHFHHVWSAHQIRSLQEDPTFINSELAGLLKDLGPTGNWAQNIKKWEQTPYPTNTTNASLSGFCVWRRIGVLTSEALETLGEKFGKIDGLDKDQIKLMTDSMWEIYWCENRILKISKRKFQPQKMPVQFIPFRRDPASIFGIGAGESALEVVEMLTNITRSIEDSLNDTSGFQVSIDAGRVENKDLKVQGRKTWIHRSKDRKGEPQGRAVEFFTVPSNLDSLMASFKTFEGMIPVVTGFIEMANGADMGSGVRTDNMMNMLWDSLEEFIKDVVGNVDRYWWKPFLRDCYAWIQEYYPQPERFKCEADLQVQGVRGALKREIVGRKAADLFVKLHQFGMPDWIDDINFMKTIVEGIGMEEERVVLTPTQHTEKMDLLAKKTELIKAAGNAPEGKERAQLSQRDAQMKAYAEIPEGAEAVKLATFRTLASELKLMTPELEKILNATMPMAIARDVANHKAKEPHPEVAPPTPQPEVKP
jgi:hypothetical protein